MSVPRYDVLVLGVGGMGAAALAHLAARGVSVLGVEQDDVPGERGSSVGETRVIRKAYFEDPRYVPLLERAYVLWRELEVRAKETLFVRAGCLNLGAPDHPDVAGVRESATTHRLPHEVLDAREVRARFPALRPKPSEVGVFEADAGYLRVEACTSAHARWAVEALFTAPRALPCFIHFGEGRTFYGLPLHGEAGRAPALKVCRHHGGEPTTADALDRVVRDSDVETVREYLRAHLPDADGPLLRSRVCMYTNTPDDHFIVGRLAKLPNVVVLGGFSGHGYKMAPVIGEIAADLTTGAPPPFDLALFSPSRF